MCILEGSTRCFKCDKRIEYNFNDLIGGEWYCRDTCGKEALKAKAKAKAKKAKNQKTLFAEFKAWKKAQGGT